MLNTDVWTGDHKIQMARCIKWIVIFSLHREYTVPNLFNTTQHSQAFSWRFQRQWLSWHCQEPKGNCSDRLWLLQQLCVLDRCKRWKDLSCSHSWPRRRSRYDLLSETTVIQTSWFSGLFSVVPIYSWTFSGDHHNVVFERKNVCVIHWNRLCLLCVPQWKLRHACYISASMPLY